MLNKRKVVRALQFVALFVTLFVAHILGVLYSLADEIKIGPADPFWEKVGRILSWPLVRLESSLPESAYGLLYGLLYELGIRVDLIFLLMIANSALWAFIWALLMVYSFAGLKQYQRKRRLKADIGK
jgi:hypothetical protein